MKRTQIIDVFAMSTHFFGVTFVLKKTYPLQSTPIPTARKALLNEGFIAMAQAVHPVTDPVKAEIVACLQAISDAGNSLDQFVALMWTLKIPHANGMISADYGLGVQVDAVRQHGVDAIYGRAAVECMMNGDYPIIIDPRKLAKYA